jgi:cytochrome c oxidase subunit 3
MAPSPVGINAVDTWAIPLLGSSVLLASGFILTLGHHALIQGYKSVCIISLVLTVL